MKHDVSDEIDDGGFGMVEREKLAVSLPARQAAVGQAKRKLLGARVAGRDVVEDAVEHDVESAFAARRHESLEILLGAQASVDRHVVEGVVAVGGRFEDRAQENAGASELHRVVEPGDQPQEPMLARIGRLSRLIAADRSARGSEGVDVPPDGVVEQRHSNSFHGIAASDGRTAPPSPLLSDAQ